MIANLPIPRWLSMTIRLSISAVWLAFMLLCVYGGLFIFLFGRP